MAKLRITIIYLFAAKRHPSAQTLSGTIQYMRKLHFSKVIITDLDKYDAHHVNCCSLFVLSCKNN